jgi:hypothetical protein
MESVVYLGSVVAIAGMAVGAMYVIVGLLGNRIDQAVGLLDNRIDQAVGLLDNRIDQAVGLLGQRIDDVGDRVDGLRTSSDAHFDQVDRRLGRLESQNESIIERVTRLEVSRAS